jgi:hypothetical protein
LCHSLNRPALLYSALMGQWYYSLMTAKLSATLQIAKRVYSLAQQQNDAGIMGSGAIPDKWMFVWQNDFLGSMPPEPPPKALERSLLFWSAV